MESILDQLMELKRVKQHIMALLRTVDAMNPGEGMDELWVENTMEQLTKQLHAVRARVSFLESNAEYKRLTEDVAQLDEAMHMLKANMQSANMAGASKED